MTAPLPVPPPVLMLAAGVAQYALSRPHRSTALSRAAAAGTAVAAVGLAGAAAAGFARARTTVDPHAPQRASVLVTSGPNSLTRNPMYLGMAGVLLAHAALWRSVRAVLPAAAFVALIDRVQIRAEEGALVEAFGQQYQDYRARVPRWFGVPIASDRGGEPSAA